MTAYRKRGFTVKNIALYLWKSRKRKINSNKRVTWIKGELDSNLDKYLKNHPDIENIKKFWVDHTRAIEKFRRYPHRNKILGRQSTDEEIKFLNGPNSSW